ncbi:TadE/TadG family type IV pilus assembly protein [Alteraurantiacibacter palmitatis]|uniref:TadE/TadG family type IV pilus assembly protein n=1 Tax=Alteraurantiacibacter palmitatis TaxID=2054628 RepID=A0ABV7E4C9_9SPHN
MGKLASPARPTVVLRRLRKDQRGAALVEFALVAPAMLLALIGLFDLSYNVYTSSLLQGSIQKAARDSTIEGAAGNQTAIDQRVSDVVRNIVPTAEISFQRRAYADFADASRPEDYSDLNGDGRCNDDEPFEDVNGNGVWDEDRGKSGMGGARDAVIYIVTVEYDRLFPLHKLMPVQENITTVARTVLRNQPYGQQVREPSVGNCV